MMSLSGTNPARVIILLARVSIFTDSPMSNTKIWLPVDIVAASITRRHASGMVMKNLVISGWVTVTGPPLAICSLNLGITEPLLPRTLPNLVVTNLVLPLTSPFSIASPSDWTYISARRFVHPMMFVGFTALSVDTITIFSTSYSTHLSATFLEPATFTLTASQGFSSISGTCLYAAAWNTT